VGRYLTCNNISNFAFESTKQEGGKENKGAYAMGHNLNGFLKEISFKP
jgi:hypothetical protein